MTGAWEVPALGSGKFGWERRGLWTSSPALRALGLVADFGINRHPLCTWSFRGLTVDALPHSACPLRSVFLFVSLFPSPTFIQKCDVFVDGPLWAVSGLDEVPQLCGSHSVAPRSFPSFWNLASLCPAVTWGSSPHSSLWGGSKAWRDWEGSTRDACFISEHPVLVTVSHVAVGTWTLTTRATLRLY